MKISRVWWVEYFLHTHHLCYKQMPFEGHILRHTAKPDVSASVFPDESLLANSAPHPTAMWCFPWKLLVPLKGSWDSFCHSSLEMDGEALFCWCSSVFEPGVLSLGHLTAPTFVFFCPSVDYSTSTGAGRRKAKAAGGKGSCCWKGTSGWSRYFPAFNITCFMFVPITFPYEIQ